MREADEIRLTREGQWWGGLMVFFLYSLVGRWAAAGYILLAGVLTVRSWMKRIRELKQELDQPVEQMTWEEAVRRAEAVDVREVTHERTTRRANGTDTPYWGS